MSQTGAGAGEREVTLSVLDPETAALVALAAAISLGPEDLIAVRAREAVGVGVAPVWVDELLLQSVLMLGYPRALVGAAGWRGATGIAGPASDPSSTETAAECRTRGEATCRLIYGSNYDRLRNNVRVLHPALHAWMVTEGYGRVHSRPGLDPARRELCTVAQIATLGTDRQLHSHLRGALNAGAASAVVGAALALVGPDLTDDLRDRALRCWADVRPAREFPFPPSASDRGRIATAKSWWCTIWSGHSRGLPPGLCCRVSRPETRCGKPSSNGAGNFSRRNRWLRPPPRPSLPGRPTRDSAVRLGLSE